MAQIDPAAQAKALKKAAVGLVLAGLIVGIGLPVTFTVLKIEVAMTPLAVDAVWLVPLAFMIFDFVMARSFWRRAMALERSAQGPL